MKERMKDLNLNFTHYKRGDIITGTIVMIGKNGAIVNIGGMRDGIVPKDELDKVYKEGDAILVMVTDKIDDAGCIILNAKDVNLALQQKELLNNIKVGSSIKFIPNEIGTAGIKGEMLGFSVFLPYSQCSREDYQSKESLKGREIEAIVIELNSFKKSIVCSTKLLQRNNDIKINANIGDIVKGVPVKIYDKYALVMLNDGIMAKISIQDLSYEHVDAVADVLEKDKEYEFKILDINADTNHILLGYKQMKPNPLDEIFKTIHLGDEVKGVVEKIYPSGAMIKLDNDLTAFALTSENSDKVNTATHYIYKLGALVSGYISNIDTERHKLNIITKKKQENK